MQQQGGQYPPQQGYPQHQGFPRPGGYPQQQPPPDWGRPQQFGWGPQQFGSGPGWQPPRKKGRSTGAILGLVGVLGAIVIAGAVVLALATRDKDSTTSQPRPASRPSITAQPTEPTFSVPTAPSSSTQPTATRPTAPPPKPRPRPKTTTPKQVLTGTRIYATGAHPATGCKMPGIAPTSTQNIKIFNLTVKACLDRSWPRQERAGGFQARPPAGIIHFSGPIETPCSGGSVHTVAFYCPANETIYMYLTEPLKLWRDWGRAAGAQGRMAARMRMLDVITHEYGHHVQQVTKIMDAYQDSRYAASYEGRLFLSRELELQATCFGAVFVGTNRKTLPVTGSARKQWDWLAANSGDMPSGPRDHGSFASNNFWIKRGFNGRSPGSCKVFSASPRFAS